MGEFWYTTSNGKRKRTPAGIKRQHDLWETTPSSRAKHSARIAARRAAIKSGKISSHDSRDIDHKNGNPTDNSSGNIRAMKAGDNRGRAQGPRKRGSKRKRYGR